MNNQVFFFTSMGKEGERK